MSEINGLGALEKRLDDMAEKAKKLDGDNQVDFDKLFNANFMNKYTDLSSIKDFLDILDAHNQEEFENLYSKYGSGFDEKDFAWAFFDIDEAKFYNLEKRKIKKASILSYEYVSNRLLMSAFN